MTQSLTDWLQQSRVVVVGVDPVTRSIRVKSDNEACTDVSCHERTVVVTEDGKTYIQDEKGMTAEIPEGGVVDALRDARSRKPSAFIILKGDRKTKYGAMADVMDAFAEANALRFNLMTELKTEQKPH